MIRLTKREKLLFILTATLILAAFIYRAILEPTVKNWKSLRQQVNAKQVRLARNLEVIAREPAVEQEFSRYQNFIFPKTSDEKQIAKLLKEVERIARESRVHITNMAPRGKERIGFYERFAINLEVEAQMPELTKFIFALENSPFLFKAETIKISLKSSQAKTLKCDLLLTKILF